MKTSQNNNISGISWLNIFLLTINICFIVAFVWYFIKSETKLDPRIKTYSNKILKKELKLDNNQVHLLEDIDQDNLHKRQVILRLLCTERYKLFNEISKIKPSKDSLNSIISRTGYLYRGLNAQNVKHLLNIKSICNEEQEIIMSKIFREFLNLDSQCVYCPVKCEKSKK